MQGVRDEERDEANAVYAFKDCAIYALLAAEAIPGEADPIIKLRVAGLDRSHL